MLNLLRRAPTLLPALALACAAPDTGDGALADSGPTDSGFPDTGDTADTGDTLPQDLNGAPPAAPVALPAFTARNQLGETRTEADLVGHPTVMWFYPAAGTYG